MTVPPLQFTMKIASRCNLACTYCYVYETGDDGWKERPGQMSQAVFDRTVARIREHCALVDQHEIDVVFHGGEPLLIGRDRFARWCDQLRSELADLGTVRLTLQTNGTLVDARWAKILRDEDVVVGVSLDGPADVNDVLRIDHGGQGSHERVVAGIDELRAAGIPLNILSVVQPGRDPLRVHEHFLDLGAQSIAYLMPDHTHHSIGVEQRRFGPTPAADFLLPILDHWWANEPLSVTVQPFKAMARAILGGRPAVDFIGNNPYNYVFVETDGTIEGLDVLRICQPGLASTGLHVDANRFADIAALGGLHRQILFDGMPLPTGCRSCPEASTCGGGYVPHRWRDGSFDHPSAWCADLLAVFDRLRALLEVPHEETELRRVALASLSAETG